MNDFPGIEPSLETASPNGHETHPAAMPAVEPPAARTPAPSVQPAQFESLTLGGESGQFSNLSILMDVVLHVSVELGRTRMSVRQVLDLQNGSVVELDRAAGEAVDIYVNNHKLARGEVVVVDDKFGVRITEVFSTRQKSGEA